MSKIKVAAFDCFGTVFDMSTVDSSEIRAYVNHVRSNNFSPFEFPRSWWDLRAHPDSADGIRQLQESGIRCIAASNGSVELLKHVSEANGIHWDAIVDFVGAEVYKPNARAYAVIVGVAGVATSEVVMVTANPGFGDLTGAAAVGMRPQVIRNDGHPETVAEFAQSMSNRKANWSATR